MSGEFHELTIDRYAEDVIASCSCGWIYDECRSPTDAARRFDAHCDQAFYEATERDEVNW